ncbi:MAG: hypothetical protein FWG34_08440 [Oscillospiraceae bacterium]|nr:hypothetical protein [Oscillospiraceae bacterium]
MQDKLFSRFENPPHECGSIPKWIWNIETEKISEEEIRRQFAGFAERDGYTGVMIVIWNNSGYMEDLFFEKYEMALRAAKEAGLDIVLWDENGFPSGHAGGIIERDHPEHTAKRLDMFCQKAQSGQKCSFELPGGSAFLGAVAMDPQNFERIDISGSASIAEGSVLCEAPAKGGDWQIMVFALVADEPCNLAFSKRRLIDYLSEEAVKAFIDVTHQAYYDRFPEYFGSVIKYAFYDEPSFWHIKESRIWTGDFNKKFKEKHGYDPTPLYPALFLDIGPDTASARNALHSLRAELYSTCYIQTMQKWCAAHGIQLTGHMDQEEILSPVSISGDLMKVFEHQDVPGVDQIFKYGRASAAYKLVSSAANNYDKPAVMCEVFGAMGEDMPIENLYKEAMDQFAKGINFMVPHGTWYDGENNVIFPPELSFRSKKFGPELPKYNAYVKKASALLRGGRHICDIAVLYPIADLQAWHKFGEGDPYLGANIAEHVNYMQIGEALSLDIRKDFTYLHPEVLSKRCSLEEGRIVLNNAENREEYRVAILPSMDVIHLETLEKLRQFAKGGGHLIAVGHLPRKSAELGGDGKVCEIVAELFEKGGCRHIESFDMQALSGALGDTGIIFDVECQPIEAAGGNFTYIHKEIGGRDIYFFANSSDRQAAADVRLRGAKALELWDPHASEPMHGRAISAPGFFNAPKTTALFVTLDPAKSVFYVSS